MRPPELQTAAGGGPGGRPDEAMGPAQGPGGPLRPAVPASGPPELGECRNIPIAGANFGPLAQIFNWCPRERSNLIPPSDSDCDDERSSLD